MTIINDPNQPEQNDRIERRHPFYITGITLVTIGILFFLERNGSITLPFEIIGWEMILILVGIFTGEKARFIGYSWLILIGIGLYFKLDEFLPHFRLDLYFGPLAFIILGAYFIFGAKTFGRKTIKSKYYNQDIDKGISSYDSVSDDYVSVVSIFGGANKNVLSKQFKGGEATSIFGGTEINLMQADFEGKVKLELTQIFGGCTVIIPPHWDLKTELVNIFGGVEDSRPTNNITVDTNKVLILIGTSVFGGIEIKSY